MQDFNGACMGLVRKFSFGTRASQGRGCFDSTKQNRTPFKDSITGSVRVPIGDTIQLLWQGASKIEIGIRGTCLIS